MSQIKKTVDNVKKELENVTEKTGLCYYASNNILFDLQNENIETFMFNTKDVAQSPIDHYFLLAKENDTYLIDTTYSQFLNNGTLRKFDAFPADVLSKTDIGQKLLNRLLEDGYSKIDDDLLYAYLSSFNPTLLPFFTLDDLIETKTR